MALPPESSARTNRRRDVARRDALVRVVPMEGQVMRLVCQRQMSSVRRADRDLRIPRRRHSSVPATIVDSDIAISPPTTSTRIDDCTPSGHASDYREPRDSGRDEGRPRAHPRAARRVRGRGPGRALGGRRRRLRVDGRPPRRRRRRSRRSTARATGRGCSTCSTSSPRRAGRGSATELIRAAAEHAQEQGAEMLALEVLERTRLRGGSTTGSASRRTSGARDADRRAPRARRDEPETSAPSTSRTTTRTR